MFDTHAIPREALTELCRHYQVQELALFGSALRPDFRPDSDLDVLVSFEPQARIGFILLSRLSRELSSLLGRNVDLVPKDGLKPMLRDDVLSKVEVLFAA